MLLCVLLAPPLVSAQAAPELAGNWEFNAELSDNTDRQVETALRAAGERVERRFFDRRQDIYRGGPADQELYDRISYDRDLVIAVADDGYLFTYAGEFERPVYTDNRSRSVSLTGLSDIEDFSLGHWDAGKLLIEAHPRDGGRIDETYTLSDGGTRLRMDLVLHPRTFSEPIELKRVFDRRAEAPAPRD
jgi:hypothetical protein